MRDFTYDTFSFMRLPKSNNPDIFRTSQRTFVDQLTEPNASSESRLIERIVNRNFSLDFIVLLIEAELRNSEIHGIGLFCREAVPKGTKVWMFNPVVDLVLDEAKLRTLPPPVINFMKMYSYRSRETRELIVNVDLSRHMNHSDTPNLVCDDDSNYYTTQDLEAGTELTCDYRAFCVEGCSDFLGHQDHSDTSANEQIFAKAAKG